MTSKIVNGKRVEHTQADLSRIVANTPTPEESYALKRKEISDAIYQIAEIQSDQLRKGYSVIEAVRWTEDRQAIDDLNWSHFSDRCGSTMTGQQYAETRVKPKIVAGDIFLNKVIAKRTDLIVTLANTADKDLEAFDYISTWNESSDYTPPAAEIVTSTAWAQLMASFSWNYKFF